MSRFGNRMPRNFDVDAYMTRLWGDSKAGPIGKAPTISGVSCEHGYQSHDKVKWSGGDLPDIFQAYCRDCGLPTPVKEYKFHPQRKWRLDYAYVANRIGIEIDGGVFTQGRHTRGAGFIEDQRKRNAAELLGWHILNYTHERYAEAIADIKIMLAKEAA